MSRGFPLYTQHDVMDCGPTCLRMVAAYYGQHYSAEFLDHENRPQISRLFLVFYLFITIKNCIFAVRKVIQ